MQRLILTRAVFLLLEAAALVDLAEALPLLLAGGSSNDLSESDALESVPKVHSTGVSPYMLSSTGVSYLSSDLHDLLTHAVLIIVCGLLLVSLRGAPLWPSIGFLPM